MKEAIQEYQEALRFIDSPQVESREELLQKLALLKEAEGKFEESFDCLTRSQRPEPLFSKLTVLFQKGKDKKRKDTERRPPAKEPGASLSLTFW